MQTDQATINRSDNQLGKAANLVPLTYEVSEWSLSSIRAWWELPHDVARSYLGPADGDPDDRRRPAHCYRTVSDSSLTTCSRSRQRTPACTACSWSRRWSGSHTMQSTATDIPGRDTLKRFWCVYFWCIIERMKERKKMRPLFLSGIKNTEKEDTSFSFALCSAEKISVILEASK